MPSSTLNQLVLAHHQQAYHIAKHTFWCNPTTKPVTELKKVGKRFTTHVERRLRKLED